jgi:predicted GTPase
MDPETKTMLDALLDGQGKLTDQVARSAGLINTLAEGQVLLARRVDNIAEGQEALAKHVDRRIGELAARVDTFNETVLRGFTDAAARDHGLERRLDELETRVAAIEHGGRS